MCWTSWSNLSHQNGQGLLHWERGRWWHLLLKFWKTRRCHHQVLSRRMGQHRQILHWIQSRLMDQQIQNHLMDQQIQVQGQRVWMKVQKLLGCNLLLRSSQ